MNSTVVGGGSRDVTCFFSMVFLSCDMTCLFSVVFVFINSVENGVVYVNVVVVKVIILFIQTNNICNIYENGHESGRDVSARQKPQMQRSRIQVGDFYTYIV
jgi:hypothetical protein